MHIYFISYQNGQLKSHQSLSIPLHVTISMILLSLPFALRVYLDMTAITSLLLLNHGGWTGREGERERNKEREEVRVWDEDEQDRLCFYTVSESFL